MHKVFFVIHCFQLSASQDDTCQSRPPVRPGAGVFRTHLGRRKLLVKSLTAGANEVQILASNNVQHEVMFRDGTHSD